LLGVLRRSVESALGRPVKPGDDGLKFLANKAISGIATCRPVV
jgi:hypothetical protein